jgi:hypothetical protein
VTSPFTSLLRSPAAGLRNKEVKGVKPGFFPTVLDIERKRFYIESVCEFTISEKPILQDRLID